MENADREKLVDSFVTTGMARERARLVVDVGVKAAEDAISTLVGKCALVGDPTGNIAAQSIAVQILAHECALRLTVMKVVSDRNDLPSNKVTLG